MGKFEPGNDKGIKFQAGEAQVETARKGGIASGQARKEKASLKKSLRLLLEDEYPDKKGIRRQGFDIVAVGLFNKAIKGDTTAIKLLAELIEEYKNKVQIGNDGSPFEMKVVKVPEDLEGRIAEYLGNDGGGPDK